MYMFDMLNFYLVDRVIISQAGWKVKFWLIKLLTDRKLPS
jgi:hypothetical protein